MIISNDSKKKEIACRLLINKASEIGCIPCRTSFTPEELVFIKAHLGALPRALEAAGLKEKRKDYHKNGNKNRIKRKRTGNKDTKDK